MFKEGDVLRVVGPRAASAARIAASTQSGTVKVAIMLAASACSTLSLLVENGAIPMKPKKKATFLRALKAVRAGLAELTA